MVRRLTNLMPLSATPTDDSIVLRGRSASN
jgi:transmembrane sensor